MKKIKELKKIRVALLFFIVAVFLSGATVLSAYTLSKQQYPFLLFDYDWLVFAHFVLAILFLGLLLKP